MTIPLVVANWKMNKTVSDATVLVEKFLEIAPLSLQVEVALAPPFVALYTVGALLANTPYKFAAQNVFWESEGAYTGEISPPMLRDLGCHYVILGHSERRQIFRETNGEVNNKVLSVLKHNLFPILCVGETLGERENNRITAVIKEQLLTSLRGVSDQEIQNVTIAYEPVWAIGTGHAASVAQVEEVHQFIRKTIDSQWGQQLDTRILYGGSVSPTNAGELFGSDQVNGALVGKACLDPESFAKLINLASPNT